MDKMWVSYMYCILKADLERRSIRVLAGSGDSSESLYVKTPKIQQIAENL